MDTSEPLTDEQLDILARCESRLGFEFADKTWLYEALTHASVADSRLDSYERLEFLGDSILGFTVCEYLFQTYPNWLEGDLTKIKSNVVSRQTCCIMARELGLEEFLVVGKGVGKSGKVPMSLLANVFESIVAAIYLDGGMDRTKAFLLPLVKTHVVAAIEGGLEVNYKSELQQYSQKRFGLPPHYNLLDDRGPDHDKWFKIAAQIDKRAFPPAWGRNKKQAEQRAAANALATIEGTDLPFPEDDR